MGQIRSKERWWWRQRTVWVAVLVLLPLLAFLGRSYHNAAPSPASSRQVTQRVRYAMRDALRIREPAVSPSAENALWVSQVCEGLVRFAADSCEVTPALAASYTISQDGHEWTFRLRQGVMFHDGTLFDAQAVHFCFMRLLDPNHPYAVAGSQRVSREIFGDERSSDTPFVRDIRTPDKQTVVLVLSAPDYQLVRRLARIEAAIVSPEAIRTASANGETTVVGTGPLRVKSVREGFSVTLERFPQYWGNPSRIREIEFRGVPDSYERERALRERLCEAGQRFSPQQLVELAKIKHLVTTRGPAANTCLLVLNPRLAPLDQPKVRRSLAFDRKRIVEEALRGFAIPAETFFPPCLVEAPTSSVQELQSQKEVARRLLEEAGYAQGFSLKILVPREARVWNPVGLALSKWIASDLGEIGIEVVVEAVAAEVARQRLASGEYHAALWGFSSSDGSVPGYLMASDGPAPMNLFAQTAGGMDEMTRLLGRLVQEPNAGERRYVAERIQELLAEGMAWVPVFHGEQVFIHNSRLGDVRLNPVGLHHVFEWSWKE